MSKVVKRRIKELKKTIKIYKKRVEEFEKELQEVEESCSPRPTIFIDGLKTQINWNKDCLSKKEEELAELKECLV